MAIIKHRIKSGEPGALRGGSRFCSSPGKWLQAAGAPGTLRWERAVSPAQGQLQEPREREGGG